MKCTMSISIWQQGKKSWEGGDADKNLIGAESLGLRHLSSSKLFFLVFLWSFILVDAIQMLKIYYAKQNNIKLLQVLGNVSMVLNKTFIKQKCKRIQQYGWKHHKTLFSFRTRQSFMANQKLFFHPNYVTIIYSIKRGLAFLALQYTQNILGINLMMEGNIVLLM